MSIAQTPSMSAEGVTYEAKQDNVGAFVPLQNKRRCLVVKYRHGKFAYVYGAFSTMRAAEKRAAHLNAAVITKRVSEAVKRVDQILSGK